jgi:hypothetical protein
LSLIHELFKKGQENIKKKAAEVESTKLGVLRAGNAGLLFEDGSSTGACQAKTWLRFRGIVTDKLQQEGDLNSRELMFEAGRINEDAWFAVMEASGWQGKILREEEIPIKWSLPKAGTLVTGRPDMALLDETGKPVIGIELKLVSAIWTARSVLINRVPKLAHLIQAAHYSWKLECPFEIWYTNRTDFETKADFSLDAYPQYGEPGSEHFTYRFYKSEADPKTGKFKQKGIDNEMQFLLLREAGENVYANVAKYKPFVQGFKLQFDTQGRLWYIDACNPDAEAQLTVVTRESIERYYESVATLTKVPKEPLTMKPSGKKEAYKLSAYCELGRKCCKYQEGKDIEKWGEEVKKEVDTGLRDKLK